MKHAALSPKHTYKSRYHHFESTRVMVQNKPLLKFSLMLDEREIENSPSSDGALILPVCSRLNWIVPREMCRLFST
jgi:hypothetical protein